MKSNLPFDPAGNLAQYYVYSLSQTISYENFPWKSCSRVSNNIGLRNNHFINLLRIIDGAWRELY